jgi:hypothetical protein
MVSDIKGYSSHPVSEHADAQQRLLQVMTFACRHAGNFRVRARDRQDRGDGRLYVLPPRLDEALVVPRLVLGLRHGLYLGNQVPGGFGRLRLRVAMARGAIAPGATGFVGRAPITACRLVDSQPARDGLEASKSADLALIVPDELYQDVIKLDFPGLPSSEFTQSSVSVKEYSGTGWVYVPKVGPALPPGGTDSLWASVIAADGVGVIVMGTMVGDPDDPDDPGDFDDLNDPIDGGFDWETEPDGDDHAPDSDDTNDHDTDDDWDH